MLTARPSRRAVAALLVALAVAAGALVPAAATADVPDCDGGADERSEYWRAACTQPPELATGGGSRVCELQPNPWGIPVACQHEQYGWWSYNWQCYVRFKTPQPEPGHPSWRGHDPSEGIVYAVTCPWMEGVDGLPWTSWPFDWFVPDGAGGIGATVAEAIGRLDITGPDIQLAPDPSGVGLVGLPVWMWTPDTAQTWSPPPLRVPVLDWVLVVQAQVDRMVWDMGNGDTVVCDQGPGTPYADRFGAQQSPDCGYPAYQWPSRDRPDGVYQVSATTEWRIDWWFETVGGQPTGLSGVETTSRDSGPVGVRIAELQVVRS